MILLSIHPSLDDEIDRWVGPFADSKRNARADLPGVNDQGRDYRQKVRALATDFAAEYGRPMQVADLFGLAPDRILRARRDGRTGAPLRPSSRNSYRRVLNAFVTWLRQVGLEHDGRIPWRMEESGAPELRTFAPEAVEVMFIHLSRQDTIPNRRLAALIALALDTGGRRGDLLSMRLSTLDLERGRAHLWVKNDKHISVPISSLAIVALRRYLAVRVDAGHHDLVFLNTAGTAPLAGDDLSKSMRRLLVAVGLARPISARRTDDVAPVPERLNFQALRRTFVRHYLDAGRSERELAAMMGWDPDYAHQVFGYYNRVGIEELAAVHEASSPLSRVLGRAR